MKSYLPFLFLWSLIVFCPKKSEAQIDFISTKLEEIYMQLPSDCKNKSSKRGESIPCTILSTPVELKILYNSLGQISHLGLKLFEFEDNIAYPASLLAFVERYALTFFLTNDINSLNKKNAEGRIYLNINGENVVSLNTNSLLQLREFFKQKNISTKIDFKDNYYTVELKKEKKVIQIVLPSDYELISGLDKGEYGKQIEQRLTTYKLPEKYVVERPKIKDLKIFDDVLYYSKKAEYFPGILADTYYACESDECIPVFDIDHVFESIRNSFLLPITSEKVKLIINQRLYGNKSIDYVVNLRDLVSYFKKDYDLFFGFENEDEKNISGTLIILNKNLNYINLLHVNFPKNAFFSTNEVLINSILYTNIPTSNVKNLFADFK